MFTTQSDDPEVLKRELAELEKQWEVLNSTFVKDWPAGASKRKLAQNIRWRKWKIKQLEAGQKFYR